MTKLMLAMTVQRAGEIVGAVVGIGILLFVLLAVLIPIATGLAIWAVTVWRRRRVLSRFRSVWGAEGKDLLLVYSNSPHWQRYVEDVWLPRWGHRAVVLNWSERSQWPRRASSEVALFRAFAGWREFNPLGIVVPAAGQKVHVVRFWRAFRDYKHGKKGPLKAAESDLERLLDPRP